MTCISCNIPLDDWKTGSRLCQDCREEAHENEACRCDPTYNRDVINTWERYVEAVQRLYSWTSLCREKWVPTKPVRQHCDFCEQWKDCRLVIIQGQGWFGEAVQREKIICAKCFDETHGKGLEPERKRGR